MGTGAVFTNNGVKLLMDRGFFGTTYSVPSVFKAGTGTTTPIISDTDIVKPVPITGTETVDACDVTTGWTDSSDATLSVNSTTFKEGVGALNWTKDGVASVNASSSKTTPSLDFTSKEFSQWVYVKDATMLAKLAAANCMELRYGSDAANYYYWRKNAVAFVVGWNLFDNLTSANATGTTGAPVIAACDYTMLQFTATGAGITWAAGDLVVDDMKLISSGDYIKVFEVGYPSEDFLLKQVTIRTRLLSTEANGYNISEHGVFNTDITRIMPTRDVFSGLAKTNNIELIFDTIVEFTNS